MESNCESLMELAYRYFMRKGFSIDFNVDVKSEDGKKQKVDMVLTNNRTGGKIGVLVINWDRSIGVNVIRKLRRIINGAKLKDGILVGQTFSAHSRRFAKDYDIELMPRSSIRLNMDDF